MLRRSVEQQKASFAEFDRLDEVEIKEEWSTRKSCNTKAKMVKMVEKNRPKKVRMVEMVIQIRRYHFVQTQSTDEAKVVSYSSTTHSTSLKRLKQLDSSSRYCKTRARYASVLLSLLSASNPDPFYSSSFSVSTALLRSLDDSK